jgi:hypothetical protein
LALSGHWHDQGGMTAPDPKRTIGPDSRRTTGPAIIPSIKLGKVSMDSVDVVAQRLGYDADPKAFDKKLGKIAKAKSIASGSRR